MLYVVLRTSSDLFAEPLTAKPTSVPISAPATLPEVTPAVPVVVPKAVVSPPKSSPPHVVRTVSKGTDVAKKAKAPVIVIDKKPLDAAPLSHERAVEPHITATVADVNPRSSPIEAQPEPEVPASDSAKPSKPSNPDQPAPTQVAHMIPISSPVEVSSAVALQSPTADSGLSITQAEPVPSEADVGLSPARKLPTLPDSPPSSSPEDLPAVPPAPAPAPVPAPVPVVQTPPKNPASVNTLPLPDSVKPAVAIVDSDAVDSLPSKPAVTSPVIKPVRAPVVLAAPKPAVAPKAAESAPISKPPVASSTSPIADASKADAGDAKVVTAPPLKQQPARQTLPTKALVKPTKKPEKGAVRQVTTTAAGHVVTKILGKGEGSNAPPLPDIKPPRPLQPSKSPISSDDPHGSSSMLNTPTSGPIVDVDVDSVVLPSASPGTTSSRLPASLFSSGEEATPSPSPPTSPVKPSAPPGISHPADNVPTSSAVYQPSAVKPVVSPQPHAPIGSAIRAPGSRLIGSSVSSPNQPTLRGTHDGQAYGLWPVSDPEPPVGLSSLFPTTSHSVAVGPAAHNTSTSGGNSQFSVLFGGGGGPASSLWDGDTRGPSAPAPLPSLNDDIMADVIHGVVDALEEPDVGMSPPRRGIPMGLGRSSGSGGYPMPQAGSGVLSSMVKEFVPQAYGGGGYTSTNPYHHRTTPQDYRYDEDYGGRSSQYLMHGVMGPVSGDRPPVPASAGSGYGRRGGGGEYGYRTQPPLPPPQRAMYSGGYTQQPPPPPPPPVMPERYGESTYCLPVCPHFL